jgi:integrase
MAHQLSNGSWRVLIRRKGHPTIDRSFARQDEAEAFERQQLELIDAGTKLWTATMTLSEAIAQYKASTRFSQKTQRTQTTESSRLKAVEAALGAYSLERLEDGQRIAAFRDARAKRILPKEQRIASPDSVRLELAALSSVLNWAVECRIILRNPLIGMHRPVGQPRKRRVFPDEEAGLWTAANNPAESDEVREAARFALIQREMGCRPGELVALLRDDVDFESRAARFRDTKYRREDRDVHLTEKAVQALAAQAVHAEVSTPASPFFFSTRSRYGGVWVPANYRKYVQLLRDKGVVRKDFHAHAVRREYVSSAFENGLSHADVMRMTGHRSYAAVQIYNRSVNLHPEVRKRLDGEAKKRNSYLVKTFAEQVGLTESELKEFLVARRASAEARAAKGGLGFPVMSPPQSSRGRGRRRREDA